MRKFVYFVLLSICYSKAALAAPFCLDIRGIPLQCDYVDANECRTRAAQLNGLCSANPEGLALPKGAGYFCLVDASRTPSCIYADRTSCEDVARRNNAVCAEVPTDGLAPDPYAHDPNRKY